MRSANPIRRRRAATAFTLIELLLVLVILAVLAAVVVPKFTARTKDARLTAAKSDIAAIELALETFEVDNGRYPSTEEGMAALMEPPGGLTNWKGPYLKKFPKDPWGNDYVYRYPGQHNPNGVDLFSMGEDGREGNDDIVNWDTSR